MPLSRRRVSSELERNTDRFHLPTTLEAARTLRLVCGSAVLLAACSSPLPSPSASSPALPVIDCNVPDDVCAEAVVLAIARLRVDVPGIPAEMIVEGVPHGPMPASGESPTIFYEVHTCFADGRYVLVDVHGHSATLRDSPGDDPSCAR